MTGDQYASTRLWEGCYIQLTGDGRTLFRIRRHYASPKIWECQRLEWAPSDVIRYDAAGTITGFRGAVAIDEDEGRADVMRGLAYQTAVSGSWPRYDEPRYFDTKREAVAFVRSLEGDQS